MCLADILVFNLYVKYFPLRGFPKQIRELKSERSSEFYLKCHSKYAIGIGLISENVLYMPPLCMSLHMEYVPLL
jgi:hypothetical protein